MDISSLTSTVPVRTGMEVDSIKRCVPCSMVYLQTTFQFWTLQKGWERKVLQLRTICEFLFRKFGSSELHAKSNRCLFMILVLNSDNDLLLPCGPQCIDRSPFHRKTSSNYRQDRHSSFGLLSSGTDFSHIYHPLSRRTRSTACTTKT